MRKWGLWEEVKFVFSSQFWRMGVLWTLQLVHSYYESWFLEHVSKKSQSYPRCRPDIGSRRPVCVITGATSGLGAAAVRALSREGFYVVLVGRCSDHLSQTMAEIKQKDPDALVKAFQVDMSSFQSMLKFKNSLQQWLSDTDMHSSIQLLINNAGILAASHRFTVDGHEQMMGTNYIGAFVLTNILLTLLKDSYVPSRVVNVSSFTHRCEHTTQVDETYFGNHSIQSKAYPYAQIYETSKFFLLLFSYKLHRQLRVVEGSTQVSVMTADPGLVKTNILRELPSCTCVLALTILKFIGLLQSPEDGVNSILDAALAPPEISGMYFFGGRGKTLPSSLYSYYSKPCDELWNISHKLFLPTAAESYKM